MRTTAALLLFALIVAAVYLSQRETTSRAAREQELPATRTAPELRSDKPSPPIPSKTKRPIVEVRTEDAAPVAEAIVHVGGGHQLLTDKDGRVEFDWPKGAERARFTIKHHELLDADEKRARSDGQWIFVLRRGLSVAGRVVFPNGKPAPGYWVNAANPGVMKPREKSWVQSDADGRFEITGLLPGVVYAQAEGFPVKTRAGARDLRFVVSNSQLRLRIENRAGDLVPYSFLLVSTALIDEYGQKRAKVVSMEAPPGGDLEIRVAARGYRRGVFHFPAWSPTAGAHELTVVLEPSDGASVSLDVRDADGERPQRLTVHELGSDGEPKFSHRFKPNGDEPVVIADLAPGRVWLRVVDPTRPVLFRDVSMKATRGRGKSARVALPAGARLEVRVPKHARKTALFVRVQPAGEEWMVNAGIDQNGVLTTFRLFAGTWIVTALRNEQVLRTERVEIAGTKTFRLDWTDLE